MLANFQGPFSSCGDGARAQGAGQSAAAAHAAGFGRQLRRQAGRLSLHRADAARGARRRPPGEMDRGPPGASARFGLGHQPRHDAGGRGRRATAASPRSTGTRSRIAARYLRAPEPATLYRMHGNLTGAYDIRHVEVRNRVVLTNKTPTGLNRGFGGPQVYYRARTADAADRGRTWPRSARRDPPQPRSGRSISLSHRHRRAARFRRLSARRSRLALRRWRPRRTAARGAMQARAQGALYGIGYTAVGRAERLQHGLHHHRADAGGAPQGRAEERRAGDRHRQRSTRSAA